MPKKDAKRLTWLTGLKTEYPKHVAELEITPERAATVDAHIAAIQNVSQKKAEWLAATAAKKTQSRASVAGLRAEIARWRTAPGMTPAISTDLQISATGPTVNPEVYKPELAVSVVGGHVRLKFKKRGVSDMNLYVRHPGDMTWRLLARVSKSPYDDLTPVAVPGTAEVREYQAIGVMQDKEFGQPSDIVSVTVAGQGQKRRLWLDKWFGQEQAVDMKLAEWVIASHVEKHTPIPRAKPAPAPAK
jgi:hypothetical protein